MNRLVASALRGTTVILVGAVLFLPTRGAPAGLRDWQRLPPADRIVRRAPGASVLYAISRVDHRLVVVDTGPPPFSGGTSGSLDPRRELQSLTRRSGVVVAGQVVAIHSQVSRDGTFLESTVQLRVEELLKATAASTPAVGDVLPLRLHGGTLRRDGREVVAMRSWATLPREGGRYLYFLVALDDGRLLTSPETALFELTAWGLRRLGGDTADPRAEAMTRMTARSAFRAVRAAATLPRIP